MLVRGHMSCTLGGVYARRQRSAAQPGLAQWTILVYMAANNNLEGPTLLNLHWT
jgi:hypothetical protein